MIPLKIRGTYEKRERLGQILQADKDPKEKRG